MNLEKKKELIVNSIYYTMIVAFTLLCLKYGMDYFSPFILAFILASILRKPALWLSKKTNIAYKPLVIVTIIIFYCTIGLLISLIGIKLVSFAMIFFRDLPKIYTSTFDPIIRSALTSLDDLFLKIDPEVLDIIQESVVKLFQSLGNLISNISVKAVSSLSGYATALPGLLIKTLLSIISTFFIASDYDVIVDFIKKQFSEKQQQLFVTIKTYVLNTLGVVIVSYLKIMTMTFLELAIGLWIIGIKNAAFVALAIAFFDILPVLGTGGIMIPWGIISLIQNNVSQGIGILLVYVVVTIIRNILEPRIVGEQIGLHPILTLSGMFVGTRLFGMVGLLGAPIAISLIKHLNETNIIKLYKS